MPDVYLVVLGIREDPLGLQLVTLGLHWVLVLPAVHWTPYLVWRRLSLVLEAKAGPVLVVLVSVASCDVLVKGRRMCPVDLHDPRASPC